MEVADSSDRFCFWLDANNNSVSPAPLSPLSVRVFGVQLTCIEASGIRQTDRRRGMKGQTDRWELAIWVMSRLLSQTLFHAHLI